MSRVCQSCGGIIGRDCFNPVECAWITLNENARQERQEYQQGYAEGYQAAKNEPPAQPVPTGERMFTLVDIEKAFQAGFERGIEDERSTWGTKFKCPDKAEYINKLKNR